MRTLPLRRAAIVLALAAVTILVTSSAAVAGSVHFKKPSPTFSKDATTFAVTASGINLSGLGNGDIKIDISATGSATRNVRASAIRWAPSSWVNNPRDARCSPSPRLSPHAAVSRRCLP